MAKVGWISVHRQLQEHWLWEDKPFSRGQAWIDLIMLANYEDTKVPYKGDVITCERGSVNLSILLLADRWGWSRHKARDFLKLLEADGMVTVNATTHRTTISIENYAIYNDVPTTNDTTKGQQKDNKGTTRGQQGDTTNNINKLTSLTNKQNTNIVQADANKLFDDLWQLYPVKKGKGQVSDTKKRELFKVGYDEMARAIERYQKDLKKDADWRKPQNGSTFFNSGYKDYLDDNYQPSTTGSTYLTKEEQARRDRTFVDLSGIL